MKTKKIPVVILDIESKRSQSYQYAEDAGGDDTGLSLIDFAIIPLKKKKKRKTKDIIIYLYTYVNGGKHPYFVEIHPCDGRQPTWYNHSIVHFFQRCGENEHCQDYATWPLLE